MRNADFIFSVMSPNNKNAEEAVIDLLLEKLRDIVINKSQEPADSLRSTTAKIHGRLTSSDRKTRERMLEKLWKKNSGSIGILLASLENCKDNITNCTLVGILRECISPKISKTKGKALKNKNDLRTNSRLALSKLISLGGTEVLIKLLINSQHADPVMIEVLVQEVLWLLGQIAQKDKNFATKVKTLNSLKLFHNLLKQHFNQNKTLLPLLLIFKNLSKNCISQQFLLRDGVVHTLEKTFVYLGYSPHLKLGTLLDCFKYFSASKLCCTKFIKIGIVHQLMRLFERWERFDGQLRLKICNSALSTLQHLCVLNAGKKAIKANGGLQLLYRFCTNFPDSKIYDSVLSRVCDIISQCLEKRELPVPKISPARFSLPGTNVRTNSVDSISDAESQVLGSYSDVESAEDEDSNVFRNLRDSKSDDIDENKFFAGFITSQRSEEDLASYNVFFKELGTLQNQLSIGKNSANQEIGPRSPNGKLNKQRNSVVSVKLDPPKILNTNSSLVINELKSLESVAGNASDQYAYCAIASKVKSIIKFVKVAYPDLLGGDGLGKLEPLNSKDRRICRSKLLTSVDRGLHPGNILHETVYDLDALVANHSNQALDKLLSNWDELRVGKRHNDIKHLLFESRFESGNLRKAIQIGPKEYDLILTPDVNSGSRHQWFYFEVSNMEGNTLYTFNIINCEKANSQFNFGMKPILFSVIEAQRGRVGWIRTGLDICYYRNCYQRQGKGKNYLTTSFTVNFPHANDVCYLAYHFPYTYSQLMSNIWKWTRTIAPGKIYFRVENLCDSLNGNENPLLTITAPNSTNSPIQDRKIIFLTSRVHPGESNASWVMKGTLEALLDDSQYANDLRENYVFKIVPMLNIEGVINGCNRYGLTNEDLNRRWSNPDPILHPTIYHTKGLMEYCTRVLFRRPHVFVDYHGHSRRKNIFLFGCSRSLSWSAIDRAKPDQPVQYLMLPYLMQKISPAFALSLCSFKVERHKESTARVAIWRQLGVTRSYTMESSFCGCDQGPLSGFHLDTKNLKDIGREFCQALFLMKDDNEDWSFEKIPMGEAVIEERGCIEDDESSTLESEESDFDD